MSPDALRSGAITGGLNGALIGLLATPLMALAYTQQMSRTELYDRCYRLRFNQRVLRMDRITALSSLVGGCVAGAPGFVIGMDVSVLAAALSS